ncbi:MAG: threonine/serine exporter family protein [Rikenellaceae bacterium]
MEEKRDLIEVADLLLDIAASLVGAGSHTSRVVHNVNRMAASFGYEVFITIFLKNLTMMVRRKGSVESITLVKSTKHMPLNFRIVAELSELSWHTHDNRLTVEQAREEYESVMATPRLPWLAVWPLVAIANASFCKLFGGDWISCGVVLLSSFVAFFVRQRLMEWGVVHPIVFVISAFISSMIASLCSVYSLCSTPDIALATSVLFLIPGVPLINSVMDILEGHVLMGISRFINAATLVVGITIGFMFTLLVQGIEKL